MPARDQMHWIAEGALVFLLVEMGLLVLWSDSGVFLKPYFHKFYLWVGSRQLIHGFLLVQTSICLRITVPNNAEKCFVTLEALIPFLFLDSL